MTIVWYNPIKMDLELTKTHSSPITAASRHNNPFFGTDYTPLPDGPTPKDFDRYPQKADCPICGKPVWTTIDHETGATSWGLAGGLWTLGCWFGLCLAPLGLNSLKDVNHRWENCNELLGKKVL